MMLIEDYMKDKNAIWQTPFLKEYFRAEYEKDKTIGPLIDFLCSKVSFWYYSDIFSENPFAPFADFSASGGGRSANLCDLSADDLNHIAKCVQYTKHPLILGFFNDILGMACHDDNKKFSAAQYFTNHAKNALQSEGHHGIILCPIQRALALLCQLKKTKEIEDLVDTFVTLDDRDIPSLLFQVGLIETFYLHSSKTYNKILPFAESLYEKLSSNNDYVAYSLRLAVLILKIYKSRNAKDKQRTWTHAFADCCSKSTFQVPQIDKMLDTAITEATAIDDFELENKLRIRRSELETDFYNSFHFVKSPFEAPKNVQDSIMEKRKHFISIFDSLDGVSQLCFFLKYFSALPKTEIEKQRAQRNKFLSVDLFNQIRFNDKKEVIFQSATATEIQKMENEIYEIYITYGAIVTDLLIAPFLLHVKYDNKCRELIAEIIDHNELVHKSHGVIIQNIGTGISEKHFRSSLLSLLPQFEDGLRNYIKRNGIMPMMRCGDKEDYASLPQMMNTAVFRKLIDDLLGEDLAQHIDYLACKKLGGDIRNRYCHEGHGDDDQFTIDEMILFFLLIKAYCMGYDQEISHN